MEQSDGLHEGRAVETLGFGFIGAGRLGTALAWSFAARSCRVRAAASRSAQASKRLAARIPGCRIASPQEVAANCDVVFVTTPDDVIADLAEGLRWHAGAGVVHCSAVTEVSALAKAARDGALIGGFHPLQTFADPAQAVRALPGSTITIEAEEPLNGILVGLATRLGCAVNRLPPGARGRYHAAAGYGSQFIHVLLREAAKISRSWGMSEDDTVRAFLPMLRGTLAAIEDAGIAPSMPGPVSRGDVASIAKHVAALAALDAEILDLYRQLCHRTIPLAEERGEIDAATAARIREALFRPSG